ncbi:MAG: T9SS type A sorting domain-containing protein [Bacteroidota bacterium]|nr:T9SS type A sorting domain-containing protein [Bacteroidota bacterium]
MKRIILFALALSALPLVSSAQCSTTNATSCACETPGSTNCDLLPDIIVARPPLLVSGNNGIIEYSQSGNGVENGRLRVSVSSPNIGHGPLEVRTTNRYICGTDTIVGTAPATCPTTGLPPRQLVTQRVYQKNGNVMSYYDRDAGSMTYHPTHGHMHVDDWGVHTLRTMTSDPNPLNWPIVGSGSKLAFCLMDYGSCSTYGGHCVDSTGATLLNGNFPNYGLGGGSYNCSPSVQGISSGYTDIYYQYLDGMYITIPPGTCNGQYYIVVQLDPNNYFLEENEDNNLLVVPYTLTQQVVSGSATITSNVQGPVCIGTSVALTANSGTGYTYLWSTGATTQSINVTSTGNYTVSVTNTCGVATSSPYAVTFTGAVPVTTGTSNCGPGSGAISATASGATINWYANSSGGASLGTGTVFNTPVINTTTSYYAEATTSVSGYSGYATPNANTIGSGGFFTSAQYLIFDAIQNFTLVSVKVYAQSATSTTVELRNSTGALLNSQVASIPAGESRITLNWPITAGSDLRLTRSGSASLYRNNGGVVYPYAIPNYLSIKSSSAGTAFYYFFYDWEISTPNLVCVSNRVPATFSIYNIPNVGVSGNTSICNGASTTLTATGAVSYSWSPAAGLSTTTGSSVSANPASTTTYTVTGTNAAGCTKAQSITVNVGVLPNVTLSSYSAVCHNSASFPLTGGSPSGGIYSGTGVSGGNFSPSTAGVGTHTITYTYSSGGCSADATSTITVNNCNCNVPGKPGNIYGTASPCPGTTINYYVTNQTYVSNYTWTAPANTTIISGQGTNSIMLAIGANYSSGSLCVVASNVCGSAPAKCKTLTKIVSRTPGNIQGQFFGNCQTVVNLSVNAVAGALSYNWTLPSGTTYISGQGTNAISFSTNVGFVSGLVCVTSFNGCTNSTSRCAWVYAGPPKPVITGPATACVNQTGVTYSVQPVYGATTYTWSVPSGSSIVSGQGTTSIVVNFGSLAGKIGCTAKNVCGNRGTSTYDVAFNCRLGEETSTIPGLNIAPNPATDYVNVIFDSPVAGETLLQLLDITGRIVLTQPIETIEGQNIITLDLASYSRGIYMVINHNNGTVTRSRLVLE